MKIYRISQVGDKGGDVEEVYIDKYDKTVKVITGPTLQIGNSPGTIRWDKVYLDEIEIGRIKHLDGKPRRQPILTVSVDHTYVKELDLEWLVGKAIEQMRNIVR